MIYTSREELPDDIRQTLPQEAQNLYMKAYNAAYKANEDAHRPPHISLHQFANEHAWKAIEREWEKDTEDNVWKKRK